MSNVLGCERTWAGWFAGILLSSTVKTEANAEAKHSAMSFGDPLVHPSKDLVTPLSARFFAIKLKRV